MRIVKTRSLCAILFSVRAVIRYCVTLFKMVYIYVTVILVIYEIFLKFGLDVAIDVCDFSDIPKRIFNKSLYRL